MDSSVRQDINGPTQWQAQSIHMKDQISIAWQLACINDHPVPTTVADCVISNLEPTHGKVRGRPQQSQGRQIWMCCIMPQIYNPLRNAQLSRLKKQKQTETNSKPVATHIQVEVFLQDFVLSNNAWALNLSSFSFYLGTALRNNKPGPLLPLQQ